MASEVRSLAQRSADAAKGDQGLIGESVATVQNGAGPFAGRAIRSAKSSAPSSRSPRLYRKSVAQAASRRAGIDQVTLAVSQMDEVTQQNAALVEEAAAPRKAWRNRRRAGVRPSACSASSANGGGRTLAARR